MFEYQKNEDIGTFSEIANFSFAVKHSRHELLRKYIAEALSSGAELYTVKECSLIVAGYVLYPFNMRLRNSVVKMGGIGLVCSRPDFRGKGAIRFMLQNAVKTMREKDMLVSVLYPFNVGFYRKYGWELFFKTKKLVLSPNVIDAEKSSSVSYNFMTFPDSELKSFYNHIAQTQYNLAIRNDHQWRRHLKLFFNDEASTGVVKFSRNGRVTGMLTQYLNRSEKGFDSLLTVKDFYYSDQETKLTMLYYLKSLSHQVKEITFYAPEDFELWPYLTDRPIEEKLETSGMIRILDLKSLSGLNVDFQLPAVKVKVIDNLIEENNGIFEFYTEGGKLKIRKTTDEPELECDISTVSFVLSGFSSLSESIRIGKAKELKKVTQVEIPKDVTFHPELF
ncbi:hypothetical protein AT15_10015 [Kosmotoga arenicorallina S304]|uniref:N-acetyltransferase domain-containing protein n=1 Tax=Kosmotoga arenicorallina S304 TaxID=1453497 RepID=A0A176K1I5_9BACT|nr:GNAT family N-acetyltransferase [Kosmotoga arenicorallina]OAA30748.1 hypothetical protein AT15_10015 [Kosmotoga arenicorallina S304]